jgi:membrane dipeptidase
MNRREFLGSGLALPLGAWAAAQERPQNERIRQDRDAGLALLKPDRKDLERGLELHRSAIVVDAYGFAPRAAPDVEAYRAALEAGASEAELEDLREEMGMIRCVTDRAERDEFIEAWRAAGMTCIFQNAGEESQDPLRLLKRLARFTFVTDFLRNAIAKAVTPDDIVAAKRQDRGCLYFSGNGVPLAQQWISAEDELRHVRTFFRLGIRMMHLTYNRRNLLGDGCAEPADAGLSDLGRTAIAEMNRTGVIVDVAHSGWRTSLEAAKASRRPVVASHTAAAGLNRHIRSKPDEVLRALADTGGYAGVCCIPSFLGGGGDLVALLDHVDYLVKRLGADHAAIGTDVAYTSRLAEGRKLPASRTSRKRYESLWPPDAFAGRPSRHASLAWTNWPLFTVGLVQRGHSDDDIRKIIGGNVLRVARAALPEGLPAAGR